MRLSSNYSNELIRLLLTGELDLAIISGIEATGSVSKIKIAEESYFVAMRCNDALAKMKEVDVADLDKRRCILFERHVNPAQYDTVQKVLADHATHPSDIQHVVSPEEAATIILQNGSLALLNRTGARRIATGGITMRPVRDKALCLKTYLAARSNEDSRQIAELIRGTVKRLQFAEPAKQVSLPLAV